MNPVPFVSIVVPCRNEEEFIGVCLKSMVENDYAKDRLEVLVVDGMSEDGTRVAVEAYGQQYPFIRLLDNPERTTAAALNSGIRAAKGDIILRVDSHARVAGDYISRCVEALEKYGADNVGGNMETLPRRDTLMGKAIVLALTHRFGVGNSHFRIGAKQPRWVDTVFGGCCRRDLFGRVGLFNEELVRGQDLEFNLRLIKAGGRTLLVPEVVSYYYARSDLKSFSAHNWANGVWAILPFLYSSIMPVSWRHLVPLAFVLVLLGAGGAALVSRAGLWALAGIGAAYTVASLASSVWVAVSRRDIRYLFAMPVVFASLHVAYGVGSLWGTVRLLGIRQFWNRVFGLVQSLFSDEA